MSDKTIARPYAQAAFEYAKAHDVVSAWQDALTALTALAKHPEIKQLFHASLYSDEQFEDLIAGFVDAKPQSPLRNFIHVVLENGRFFVFPDIYAEFVTLHNASDTVLPATVTSAVPLTESEKARIVEKLESKTQQKVVLTCAEDHALLGGIVVRYGDKVIDASLKHRLSALANNLTECVG